MALSYTTTATAWGGRMGRVATSDGKLDYRLSMPESMGGEGGEGTNPEQLFATGYAACFHNAVRSVARKREVDVTDSAVSVTVTIVGTVAERSKTPSARTATTAGPAGFPARHTRPTSVPAVPSSGRISLRDGDTGRLRRFVAEKARHSREK